MSPPSLNDPHSRRQGNLPRFLVISPPKTGSTWLADNLRCHPQLFVPAIKEVKYFSTLYKCLDLQWYAAHFTPLPGQIVGEASPSYASLPLASIRAIRDLMPDVKLVFLMRDPVSRAWSHAKHTHLYREASFENYTATFEEMTEPQWCEAFADDWQRVSGDYLGQLRRWLTVFPAEQIFVGFFEDIVKRPVALLREVFSFLGVEPNVDLSHYPVKDRILAGPEGKLTPGLEEQLRQILGARTEELARFLLTFGLTPPPAWQRTLRNRTSSSNAKWNFTEADLERLATQEEYFRTAYRELHFHFRGHDLFFFRGRLIAIPHGLGQPDYLDGPLLERQLAEGTVLTAATLPELKELVTTRALELAEARFRSVEAALREELRAACEVATHLRIDLQTLVAEVRQPPPPLWKRTLHRVGRRIARHSRRLRLAIFG